MLLELFRFIIDKIRGTTEKEKRIRQDHDLTMMGLKTKELNVIAIIDSEKAKSINASIK